MNLIGSKLNERYVIEKELGRGGLGIVYRALDIPLDSRPVVIKTMLGAQDLPLHDPWFREKFEKEIAALIRVTHPGVVGLLDVGQMQDGKPFFVMPYVEGENLRSAIRRGGMELKRAANIIRQVGFALSAAHDKGVTHRDLKPENIMLRTFGSGEEVAILIDFGIATVKDLRAEQLQEKTRVAGTLPYMAPEQLRGEPVTASDIWSLGVVAYEMVTGRLPFPADNVLMLADVQRAGVSATPKALRPELPARAQEVILKALAYDPDSRYQHAHDMGEEFLRAILETEEPTLIIEERKLRQQLPTVRAEDGHILLIGLVGHSGLPMSEPRDLIRQLSEIVRRMPEFQRAQSSNQLICLPTGDGMALIFFQNPMAPVHCALEIAEALRNHPNIKLRMGLHSGPVIRGLNINENLNVAGSGLDFAQQVMNSGDAGHIIVSKRVADNLIQLGHWQPHLHDLGEQEVGPGVLMRLFNLCKGELGCPNWPSRLERPAVSASALPPEVLLRRCRELFESLDEFLSPETLRPLFRTAELRPYERCVRRAGNLDFDQLLDCLNRAGRDYKGQALVELLGLLASRYKDDYRQQECLNLRDGLRR